MLFLHLPRCLVWASLVGRKALTARHVVVAQCDLVCTACHTVTKLAGLAEGFRSIIWEFHMLILVQRTHRNREILSFNSLARVRGIARSGMSSPFGSRSPGHGRAG